MLARPSHIPFSVGRGFTHSADTLTQKLIHTEVAMGEVGHEAKIPGWPKKSVVDTILNASLSSL